MGDDESVAAIKNGIIVTFLVAKRALERRLACPNSQGTNPSRRIATAAIRNHNSEASGIRCKNSVRAALLPEYVVAQTSAFLAKS